jgi:hypothetical protein
MATIRFSRNLGLMLAGLWLILTGVFQLFRITFPAQPTVMGILALIAGILVFIEYKD